MAAARNVVSMYSQMTVPKRRSSLDEPCASALATMTKTSTGAMPFRAPTNRVPSSATQPAPGTVSASTAPMTRPHRMRTIRLMLLYLAAAAFKVFISKHSSVFAVRPLRTFFPSSYTGRPSVYSLRNEKSRAFPHLLVFHLTKPQHERFLVVFARRTEHKNSRRFSRGGSPVYGLFQSR